MPLSVDHHQAVWALTQLQAENGGDRFVEVPGCGEVADADPEVVDRTGGGRAVLVHDSFDRVVVAVANEGAEVARAVLRPRAWRASSL